MVREYKYFVGIDGGFNGGICILNAYDSSVITFYKMPICISKGKNKYDIPAIINILESYKNDSMMCIENVPIIPMNGSISIHKSAYNLGLIVGIFEAMKIEYNVVNPQEWQKTLLNCGLYDNYPNIKEKTKAFVMRLLRDSEIVNKYQLQKKCNNGLIDAFAIAKYCEYLYLERFVTAI